MGKIIFVEILDRRGTVRERVKVDSFPATVGRGYGNAVIVDDRLVGVEHLRLSLDGEGGMIVEDLHSANGTWLAPSRESRKSIEQQRVPAGGEALLRIGQTVLRLRGDDFAVGPALSSRAGSGVFGSRAKSGLIAFLVFAAGFGLNLLVFAQKTTRKEIGFELIAVALSMLVVFGLWTGFWSFLSRLVAHRFRFMTHLALLGGASILFLLLLTAEEYVEFLFTAPAAARAAGYAGFAVIFSLLLYGHLSVLSDSPRLKRILSSVLISAVLVGVTLLVTYMKEKEFTTELRFSSVLKPLGRSWVRTVSPDDYFDGLLPLKAKIDAMAREGSTDKKK
jgi:hypothetical protein